MTIEHIIFDMDGTLVDSEFCSAKALVDVLPQFLLDPQQILEEFRGAKTADVLATLSSRYNEPVPSNTIDKFRQRETELGPELIVINPGVAELLDSLTISYCIASNAPVEKTSRSLRSCGIYHYFEHKIYSAYEVDAWKPDPTLFLHAAKSQGFEPHQCIVVEDSEVGISAAVAAGMRPVFYNPQGRETPHTDIESVSALTEISSLVN